MANDNATDHAATIRAELKKAGYSSRDVSVKSDYFSMGSAIRIRIKNPKVPVSLVKVIAEPAESIRRCDYTGEILSGGNRYVTISYDHAVEQALAAPYLAAVTAALATLTPGDDNRMASVEGVPNALVGLYRGHMPSLWGPDGFIGSCGSAESVAFKIGEMVANS